MPKFDNRFFNGIVQVAVVLFLIFETGYCEINEGKFFKEAADFLNRGMYLEAFGAYREIADFSDNVNSRARALLFIGTSYSLYLDQKDAAVTIYETILRKFPESVAAPDALFNLGMIYYEMGYYKKAYNKFVEYLDNYPKGMRRQSVEVWADSALNSIGSGPSQTTTPRKLMVGDTMMRVLLKKDAGGVNIHSDGYLTVNSCFNENSPIKVGVKSVFISSKNGSIFVNRKKVSANKLSIESKGPVISIENQKYRGKLVVSANKKGLSIINYIPVESYLYGVVPKEMPDSWEMQALMAQAISARTYALYIKRKSSDREFDVETTTSFQVYGGYDCEKIKTNHAVDATRGKVLSYRGNLIVAYFHSNSGGHTEDSKNVWGADLPYLKGVPDYFSEKIPNSSWECFIKYYDLKKKLNKSGFDIRSIKKFESGKTSKSGRTTMVSLASENGKSQITGNNFRIKMGADVLRSTLFEAIPGKDGVFFKGKGFGHGVGLSQWGALKMAQAGYTYKEILKHYYQGVDIVTIGEN